MTTRYLAEFGLQATVPAGYDFEAFLDRVFTHLLDLEDTPDSKIADPDVTAKLTDHKFDVQMSIAAADPIEVQMCGLTAIRTALHVAGAATPGWEVMISEVSAQTRAAELLDA